MSGFIMHVFYVLACVGLGITIKYVWDNMRELDAQVSRLRNGDGKSGFNPVLPSQLPQAMRDVKLSADPQKIDKLKQALRK